MINQKIPGGKLACDETWENIDYIDGAAKIEHRSRASFIRTACLERAKKIIQENKEVIQV